MHPLATVAIGVVFLFVLFSLVWLVQRVRGDASIIDPFWSYSLGAIGVLYAALGTAPDTLRLLLGLMAGLWAFRLGTYLLRRAAGHGEDRRYTALREEWGEGFQLKLFGFYQFQGLFSMLLSVTFLVVAYSPVMPNIVWLVLGLVIWVVSVAGEAIADAQLARFKRNPANKNRVCREGLWYYSRHPNYFFESLHWLAYIPLAAASSWWWATLASPAIMAFLLLKVSGVPTVEKRLSSTRREGHDEYVRTTSPFIPWPPKK